jgi:hypothetical protein
VYKVDSTGNETVLYRFSGGADGEGSKGVSRDLHGNLYGITVFGGITTGICAPVGCGTVFGVTP